MRSILVGLVCAIAASIAGAAGVQQPLVGVPTFGDKTILVGVNGTAAGFHNGLGSGDWGNLAPSRAYLTANVIDAGSTASDDFVFAVDTSSYTSTFFGNIDVEDGTGASRNYTAASATFSTANSKSTWSWGTGSNRVYVAGDSGEAHPMRINP